MSIGKNAIKRVENGGYANVKTEAPDMQNSTVLGAPAPEVMGLVEKSVEKQAPVKKTTAKKAAAKAPTGKTAAKKPCAKKDGFSRVEIGGSLPYYLL